MHVVASRLLVAAVLLVVSASVGAFTPLQRTGARHAATNPQIHQHMKRALFHRTTLATTAQLRQQKQHEQLQLLLHAFQPSSSASAPTTMAAITATNAAKGTKGSEEE